MKKNANKGFSLVELIIVIAIMAVLIGVLAPQFVKYIEKSKESKDITNLDSCVEAVKFYYADKDDAPETVSITVDGGIFKGSDTDNKALKDAGAANCKVTGKWDTPLSATVHLTDANAGKVDYVGTAKYFEADGSSGYKTK